MQTTARAPIGLTPQTQYCEPSSGPGIWRRSVKFSLPEGAAGHEDEEGWPLVILVERARVAGCGRSRGSSEGRAVVGAVGMAAVVAVRAAAMVWCRRWPVAGYYRSLRLMSVTHCLVNNGADDRGDYWFFLRQKTQVTQVGGR